jgi:hypothetical protein
MKVSALLALVATVVPAFATTPIEIKETIDSAKTLTQFSKMKQYSNTKQILSNPSLLTRTIDYPTQIVRMTGDLVNSEQSCEQIFEQIDAFFMDNISYTQFYYNTMLYCGYDPNTEFAVNFSIDSYFDPLSDTAIDYLKDYLAKHNGFDLLGTPFVVENAKGLVVSLNVDAGISQADDEVLLRYQHDNKNHYFASNYQLMQDMISDVYQRFYSNDANKILPFMKKWFYSVSDKVYHQALRRSNFVLLQPERVFLMESEPLIYSPALRMYFAHHCEKYENKRCL